MQLINLFALLKTGPKNLSLGQSIHDRQQVLSLCSNKIHCLHLFHCSRITSVSHTYSAILLVALYSDISFTYYSFANKDFSHHRVNCNYFLYFSTKLPSFVSIPFNLNFCPGFRISFRYTSISALHFCSSFSYIGQFYVFSYRRIFCYHWVC